MGSEYILEQSDSSEHLVMEELRKHFRPEFINRIDEIILFKSLGKEIVSSILTKLLSFIEQRLAPSNIHLSLTEKAKNKIIEESYDYMYGARPIKRYVTKNIETLIAEELLKETTEFNDRFVIDVMDDMFVIQKENED